MKYIQKKAERIRIWVQILFTALTNGYVIGFLMVTGSLVGRFAGRRPTVRSTFDAENAFIYVRMPKLW